MEKNVKEIVEVSKKLYERQLVSGKAGNVSARFKGKDSDVIAITPTMKSLEDLDEKDIVLVDLEGNPLTQGTPSSELSLHLGIYNARDDVKGIVHTHSPYATGFAFSSKRIKRLEGFGAISTPFLEDMEYETPGTPELAENAVKAIGEEDVLILKHHGVLCVAENLKEAASLANFVEDTAKTQFISHMLNSIEDLI